MKVLILAAGYGTRLYPIIKDIPKPLLDVADKPIIEHVLDKIKSIEGLQEVLVVTNEKFYGHFTDWADNCDYVVPVKVINDGTTSPGDRLGSVGDIRYVLNNYGVEDDLLVIGGDNLFDYPLEESIEFARQKNSHVTIGLYDIGNIDNAKQFGVVAIDDNGKVVSFEEKPEEPKSSLIAMCYYYFPQETLVLVEDYIRQSQKTDKAGDYIRWLSEEKGVYGFTFEGKWYDIGNIEAYHEAEEKFRE